MGIRNSKDLGDNLFIIAKRLLQNQRLCQLLYNTGRNPYDEPVENTNSLLHNNILIVPRVDARDFKNDSKIAIYYPAGSLDEQNYEFKNITLNLVVYVPLDNWVINDNTLRPFAIMSEIEETLKNKRLNGIGLLKYNGFEISTLTDEMSGYTMEFSIDVFD